MELWILITIVWKRYILWKQNKFPEAQQYFTESKILPEIKEGKLLLLLLNDTFQDVNQIVNVIDLNVSFQYHIFQINW